MSGLQVWVPHAGFEWAEAPHGPLGRDAFGNAEHWLVPRSPLDTADEGQGRAYNPMDESLAVFRIFAEIDYTADQPEFESALCDFANKYGPLGIPESMFGISSSIELSGRMGEPLTDWFLKLRTLSDVVRLWDTVRSGDVDALSRQVELREGAERRVLSWRARSLSHWPPWWQGTRLSEPYEMFDTARASWREDETRDWLQWRGQRANVGVRPEEVSSGSIDQGAAVIVVRTIESALHRSLSVDFVAGTPLQFSYSPATLLAAMWFQFALEVSRMRQPRDCESCRLPFQLVRKRRTPEEKVSRKTKRYCSDSCRYAAANALRPDRRR